MRNKIYSLVAFIVATLTVTSCLNDSEENTGTTYRDTAITGFTLGQLKQVRDTLTKQGADSTYTVKFNAGSVRFFIDHSKGLIYNPDSLPYGTDAAHVLTTVTAKNGGVLLIKSAKDETLSYYRSNDSIDFTTPRIFRVYANSGEGYRDYEVKVNVHKQRGNVFSWQHLQAVSDFASFKTMKAVSTGDKVFVFGSDGSQTTAYAASKENGNSWTKQGRTFTADAWKSVAVQNGTLFVIDNGTVYSSADGNTWTAVATDNNLKQLVAASPAELFALAASGGLMASRDNGATWADETLDSNASLLPADNISCSLTDFTSDVKRVLLVGTLADGTQNVSWTKLSYRKGEPWTYVESNASKFLLPLYNSLSVVSYDKAALALGVNSSGRFENMLVSRDGGITWKNDKSFAYPSGAQASSAFTAAVDADEYLWIISGSDIWRGRLNRIGWALNLK